MSNDYRKQNLLKEYRGEVSRVPLKRGLLEIRRIIHKGKSRASYRASRG